jgi:hypothetical protein
MTGRCVIRVRSYTSDKGRRNERGIVYYHSQHNTTSSVTLHYTTPGHAYYAASRRVVSCRMVG